MSDGVGWYVEGPKATVRKQEVQVFNRKSKRSVPVALPMKIIHVAFNIQMDGKSCVSMTAFFAK